MLYDVAFRNRTTIETVARPVTVSGIGANHAATNNRHLAIGD